MPSCHSATWWPLAVTITFGEIKRAPHGYDFEGQCGEKEQIVISRSKSMLRRHSGNTSLKEDDFCHESLCHETYSGDISRVFLHLPFAEKQQSMHNIIEEAFSLSVRHQHDWKLPLSLSFNEHHDVYLVKKHFKHRFTIRQSWIKW